MNLLSVLKEVYLYSLEPFIGGSVVSGMFIDPDPTLQIITDLNPGFDPNPTL
jgi:hypothetical protein